MKDGIVPFDLNDNRSLELQCDDHRENGTKHSLKDFVSRGIKGTLENQAEYDANKEVSECGQNDNNEQAR